MTAFIVGTRGSRLALRQTEVVVSRLQQAHPGLPIRAEMIRTTGDRHPELPIGELTEVGFFVKELELALLDGTIDAAVHSMKDVPSAETPGLMIAAMPPRDDPRDVLVARRGTTLESLPAGARIGTSSARRAAALLALRPDLTIAAIRGNVETRIRKVDTGDVDAVCLAGAGLRRLGLEHRITHWFAAEVMVPAPGQGALGVQVRAADDGARKIVAAVDDASTRTAVLAERVVLRRLEAGCRLPLGAHGVVDGGRLSLRAAVASSDGRQKIAAVRSGAAADWQAVADAVADELLAQGAGVLAAAGNAR